jgi:molecular chaperone GrpE
MSVWHKNTFGNIVDLWTSIQFLRQIMENTNSENEILPGEENKAADNAAIDDNSAEEVAGNKGNEAAAEALKLQNELAEQKDKYIRLYSEFENFRRRTSKEKLELTQSANEQLLKAFLAVADDFERAEKSFKDKNDKELEGFFLIQNKFKKVLEQHNVKVMDLGKGSAFDADFHEAITQIPAPDEKLKGKIVDVVEKGYLLNEKVIRFAKVVVGS